MNQLLHRFLRKEIEKNNPAPPDGPQRFYRGGKILYRWRVALLRIFKDAVFIGAGALAAAFGLKSFLLPNDFIDGGAVGIALLLVEVTQLPLWVFLLLVNLPFVLMGYYQLGRVFALKTSIAIVLLVAATAFVPFPIVTQEKLLVAVFGGFFVGAGIGLAVRGGSVMDGSEVLALSVSKKAGMTIGDVILVLNILIFSAAAWLLSVETALYSLLAYMSAARTVDYIVEGVEEYMGVTIISPKNVEIKASIHKELERGVTIYAGRKGIGRSGVVRETDILYTVITRLEIGKLYSEIEKIDPNAFVVMSSVKDTRGGMIKRRPLH